MPLLARRNIRIIGSYELLFPALAVERIELIHFLLRGKALVELEVFHLENGMRAHANDLIFVEPVDADLLIAMRLEAHIMSKSPGASKRRG